MSSKFSDIDINAKLPIIRAENLPNGIIDVIDHNFKQNGLTNHYHDCDHRHKNNNSNSLNNNNNNNSNHHTQLDLPKPSFRMAENSEYRRRACASLKAKRDSPSTKDSYYHYKEPTPEDLMEGVEYDMDQEDVKWLKMFNDGHAGYNYQISESDFEKVIDRLEKESYFETKSSGKEVVLNEIEDAVCTICGDGESYTYNYVLLCDMCDLAVHQECYGVPYIPEEQWLCRRCLLSPSRNVDCVLCPNKGGAFKQTDTYQWAHVICASWIPEVSFGNAVFLEPVDHIDKIPPARWKLICYICKQKKKGACIQCQKANCYVPFHVTCAQQAGLYMKISTDKCNNPDGLSTDVKKEAFCDVHSPNNCGKSQGMYSEGSEDDDIDSQAFKRKQKIQREKMKKTRKILEERREVAFNPIAEPKVKKEKLTEISKLLSVRGRKKTIKNFDELREAFIRTIETYWLLKRKNRNGVPLLRRLQVSYNNNIKSNTSDAINLDREKYARLRYDLEKARLLVDGVKRRELLKKKLFHLSRGIVELHYEVIDQQYPPTEE